MSETAYYHIKREPENFTGQAGVIRLWEEHSVAIKDMLREWTANALGILVAYGIETGEARKADFSMAQILGDEWPTENVAGDVLVDLAAASIVIAMTNLN